MFTELSKMLWFIQYLAFFLIFINISADCVTESSMRTYKTCVLCKIVNFSTAVKIKKRTNARFL